MGGSDQKLEVIRKLLAKAEKAATPEEASAYNANPRSAADGLIWTHAAVSAQVSAPGCASKRRKYWTHVRSMFEHLSCMNSCSVWTRARTGGDTTKQGRHPGAVPAADPQRVGPGHEDVAAEGAAQLRP